MKLCIDNNEINISTINQRTHKPSNGCTKLLYQLSRNSASSGLGM